MSNQYLPETEPKKNSHLRKSNKKLKNVNNPLDSELLKKIQNICRDLYNINVERVQILLELVFNYTSDGGEFNDNTLLDIGRCINNKGYTYYGNQNYYLDNPSILLQINKLLDNGFCFDIETSLYLMRKNPSFIKKIMDLYDNAIDYNFVINCNKYDNSELISALICKHNVKINFSSYEMTEYMFNKEAIPAIVEAILNESTFVIDDKLTNFIAEFQTLSVLKRVIVCGSKISDTLLEYACKSNNDRLNKVKFLLDNKIQPTSKAFAKILEASGKSQPYGYWRARERGVVDVAKEDIIDAEKTIELLTQYGYVVTYDDLKLALEKKVVIKNIKRFNIKFDMEYLQICAEVGIYPYDVPNLSPDQACLATECRKGGNLPVIKKLISKNGLVPGTEAMRASCTLKQNIQTVKYLVSKGGVIDLKCLENIIGTIGNRTLDYVFFEFKQTYNKNDNDLPDTNLPDTSHDNNPELEKKDDDVVQDAEKIHNNIELEKKEDTCLNKIQTIITKIPNQFNFSNSVYNRIPQNICKLLMLGEKNSEIDYIDFRFKLLEYANNNSMIHDKLIHLKDPITFNGQETITLSEVNEWVYSLLHNNENITILDVDDTVRKPVRKRVKKIVTQKKVIKQDMED